MIRDPWLRALSILGCAIAGVYLTSLLWQVVMEFADIILLFFLAWLVAFILEPVVGTLVEGRLPRLAAIGLTYHGHQPSGRFDPDAEGTSVGCSEGSHLGW